MPVWKEKSLGRSDGLWKVSMLCTACSHDGRSLRRGFPVDFAHPGSAEVASSLSGSISASSTAAILDDVIRQRIKILFVSPERLTSPATPSVAARLEPVADNSYGNADVDVIMTLTAPGCPVAGEMPGWLADAIEPLPGVKTVNVQLTWDPPWGMEMMSDEARLELGFM